MLELKVIGVSRVDEHPYPIVLLRHETRILPILIGQPEAHAIQLGLSDEKTARPMTHDLVCNLLAGLRAELQSVTIYRLESDTFFAHLNIEQRNAQGNVEQVLRIDTRPSDGVALAVRVGCPIYAAEEVMDMAAQEQDISTLEEDSDPEDFEGGEEDFPE